jgi:ribosomal protein S18 acetylase RimI-like enzyme
MNIEFETAKSSDYTEIYALMQESARELSSMAYQEEVREIFDKFYKDRTPEYIKQTLENPNKHTLLAISDNRIIGFIQLEVHNKTGTISHLYILPGFEGQSIGTQLFDLTKEKAKAMSIETLLVESTLNAITYYEKLGFANLGPIPDGSAYHLEMELECL